MTSYRFIILIAFASIGILLFADVLLTFGQELEFDDEDYTGQDDVLNEILQLQQQFELEELEDAMEEAQNIKNIDDDAKQSEGHTTLDLLRRKNFGTMKDFKTIKLGGTQPHGKTTPVSPMHTAFSGNFNFGKQQQQQQQQQMESDFSKSYSQRHQQQQRSSAGSTNANDELWAKIMLAKESKSVNQRAEEERIRKLRIPRKFGRPVEQILDQCLTGNRKSFALLGLSKNVNEDAVKKAFRALTLRIHPDKNPHPDAKHAFDCLQEAYSTSLDKIQERQQHSTSHSHVAAGGYGNGNENENGNGTFILSRLSNQLLQQKQQQLHKLKKWMKSYSTRLHYQLDSLKARYQLLAHRVRGGEWNEEVNDLILEPLLQVRTSLLEWKDRFCYAPTAVDKLSLCGELIIDHKIESAAVVLAAYALYELL